MLHTAMATRGMVTAPHHLAAEAGLNILRDGGNAIEAMVAAAATIAIVYPHMNSIGGDGFWLIHTPGQTPIAIDACGRTGQAVTIDLYQTQGLNTVPSRGPLAANTVAGTISGWQEALKVSTAWDGKLSLAQLLEEAIYYANKGVPITTGQQRLTTEKLPELHDVPGFADAFLPNGKIPEAGSLFIQPRLAHTLQTLAANGLDDFYRGELARVIANDLQHAGSPINAADLANHHAQQVTPLSVQLKQGTAYNLTPPTQGLASLMILGLFERLGVQEAESFAHIHGLVEAIKQAFLIRDQEVTDPAYMKVDPATFLTSSDLDQRTAKIDQLRALPWPYTTKPGDTIWMGAVDQQGRAVSFIQSIYWEFGSGVVLQDSGIHWQNRGSSFQLRENAKDALQPGRKPFHTLNPALALLNDGRVMPYGNMGGEGQPQTQAAVFTRYALFGQGLQQAITAPRWLLGRTWGEESTNLKLESRFDNALINQLRQAGHDVQIVEPFTDIMGHAGALVHHPNGLIEGAADPRSDGRATGF